MTLLRWETEVPELRRPVLLVALEGFIDAGAVTGTVIMFLRHRWRAEVLATFDGDALLDYRARRPHAVVGNGMLQRVDLPTIELLVARLDGPHDVLMLVGPEPDMYWQAFFAAVTDVCRDLGVEEVLTVGAYPAAVPHTRPVRITKARNAVAEDIVPEAVGVRGYTGPVGAATALQGHLGEHGTAATGLWAEVPHYLAGAPNPIAALAMVELLAGVLGVRVDTTELQAAATLHREQVDAAIAEHEEAAEMVTIFEQHHDAGEEGELPTGEEIAAEIERYLRSQSEG